MPSNGIFHLGFPFLSDAYYIPHPPNPQYVTLIFDEESILLFYIL
jgi:hypothetical protein